MTDLDAILGDMAEEYALRHRDAPVRARCWYLSHLVRSTPPVIAMYLRRSDWRTLGAAVAIYVGAQLAEAGTTAVTAHVWSFTEGPSRTVSVAIGLLTAWVAGNVATHVRRGAATPLAVMTMLTVAILMIAVPHSAPLWYQLVFLIGGPSLTIAGSMWTRTTPASDARPLVRS